jgi:hypothetical protein
MERLLYLLILFNDWRVENRTFFNLPNPQLDCNNSGMTVFFYLFTLSFILSKFILALLIPGMKTISSFRAHKIAGTTCI